MTPERWQRLQELLDAVLALPPDRRDALLADECAGDAELRRQVESLVLSSADASEVIGGAIDGARRGLADFDPVQPGDRVGPYRVLREIGRGGMGRVVLAIRDDDQFSKQVAIKLVRADAAGEDLMPRFRFERQILANLEHPGIARLLDGGATASGLPFFVMEYVDGLPITEYCEQHGLAIPERLRLFREVCAAVQFAHQRLVVHRDIKPGNILVTAAGEPKLLDFGLAKLVTSAGPPGDPLTRTHMRLMTREYASPEQIRGGQITTAADVYSLGVLLYELLSGRGPYRATSASGYDLEREICEQEPVRPSTHRSLPADLDHIVLMAMRKEPERRYASVEQLSEDLRSFLLGYPVKARAGAWSYRAAKAIRRNRVAAGAAALVAVLILGFGVSMAALAARLERERDRAERVSSFLVNVFRVADPSESRGASITAREILDRGAARIDQDLEIDPAVRATLKLTIGRVYQSVGLHTQALPLLREARATRESLTGPNSRETAEALHHLAWSVEMRGDNAEAEKLYRQALDLRRARLGVLHEDTVESMASLAGLLRVRGRYPESERLYREVLAARRPAGETSSVLAAETMHDLAQTLHDQAKYAEAEPLFRDALAIRRARLGNNHPEIPDNLNNLALLLYSQGRYTEAEPVYRESLDLYRKVLGPEHHDVGTSLGNLALLLSSCGRAGEAIPLYREAIALRRKILGPNHQLLANTMKNLADLLKDDGNPAEAEELYRDALVILRNRVGEEHQYVAGVLRGQALLHTATGRLEDAEGEARRSLGLRRRLFGEKDHRVADSFAVLGRVLAARGDSSAAESLFRDSLRIYRKSQPPGFPGTVAPLLGLADVLIKGRSAAEAEPLLREALEIRRKSRPEGHWSAVEIENSLAVCLMNLGRPDEARSLLRPLPAGFSTEGLSPRQAARTRAALLSRSFMQ